MRAVHTLDGESRYDAVHGGGAYMQRLLALAAVDRNRFCAAMKKGLGYTDDGDTELLMQSSAQARLALLPEPHVAIDHHCIERTERATQDM